MLRIVLGSRYAIVALSTLSGWCMQAISSAVPSWCACLTVGDVSKKGTNSGKCNQ